jgi:hypothetical protein
MGVQRRSEALPAGGIVTDAKRYSMDGTIQSGDVVVSHVNGTRDFYIVATVLSTTGDLTLHNVSTMTGEDAAVVAGYERLDAGRAVWLFGGSAAAYVKAPAAESLLSRDRPTLVIPESVGHDESQERAVRFERSGENCAS